MSGQSADCFVLEKVVILPVFDDVLMPSSGQVFRLHLTLANFGLSGFYFSELVSKVALFLHKNSSLAAPMMKI